MLISGVATASATTAASPTIVYDYRIITTCQPVYRQPQVVV